MNYNLEGASKSEVEIRKPNSVMKFGWNETIINILAIKL